MIDVPNKTLVGLLVIAILISLAGTWMSISKLAKVPWVTGLPTEGNVSLTILQQISINVSNFSIDFGTGFVNDTFEYAFLDTEGDNVNIPAGQGNSSGWNQSVRDQAFRIENLGSTIINVTVSANANGTGFICQNETIGVDCGVGINPPDCSIDNANSENYLCFWANNLDSGLGFGETGTCKNLSNGTRNDAQVGRPEAAKPVTLASTANLTCGYMNFSDSQDEFVFEVRIIIPNDAEGRKNVTFTFSGVAAGSGS